eukprot:Nitzschia sp. Nitz4//scaffold89_size161592//60456//62790//NITZ4_002375-RA/size161592-snap-gene-0.172-mRNA-1//-1//CDS//3329559607//6748//frame0
MKGSILVAALVSLSGHITVADSIECVTGWNSQTNQPITTVVPNDSINDGYCDCPYDGLDEPSTPACAGSQHWPGLGGGMPDSDTRSPLLFQCPQQPKLKLPSSRLNDGICDCCDGADELLLDGTSPCTDTCEELLRAERLLRQTLETNFRAGYTQRQQKVADFEALKVTKRAEIETLEKEQQQSSEEEEKVEGQLQQLWMDALEQRQQITSAIALSALGDSATSTSPLSFLRALDKATLELFMVHACQLAGEMNQPKDHPDTCAALRLAGLELGMTWSQDKQATLTQYESTSMALAERHFDNAAHNHHIWDISHDIPDRRRLDEIDYYADDDYGRYMDTDDYYHYEEEEERERYRRDQRTKTNKATPETSDEDIEKLKQLPFSDTRMAFLTRSSELLAEISKLENEESEEEEAKEQVKDPAALSMVRSALGAKEKTIQRGLRWAASAVVFFKANTDLSEQQLSDLAIWTLYHGEISSVQVWQILQKILPDLLPAPVDDETCASPWASACPPKSIVLGDSIQTPPAAILKEAETFCADQVEVAIQSCSVEADSVIPSSIPDGYFGYSSPVPRDAGDPLALLYEPLRALTVDKDQADELQKRKKELKKADRDASKAIDAAWKEIGGKDGSDLGRDGELHSLRNECFSVESGKYTYELCMNGRASQKEGKGSGTNLGNFESVDYDEETGERTLKWANGQKCWNGPARSATAHVTCGPETKVLSAEEPEMCQYMMKMESYIACDDTYKAHVGL